MSSSSTWHSPSRWTLAKDSLLRIIMDFVSDSINIINVHNSCGLIATFSADVTK